MKHILLNILRQLHMLFRKKALPDRIAIYFHELPESYHKKFFDGVKALLDMGYVTVDAQTYVSEDGPSKRLFISFDDNFEDWHKSLDMMDKLGITSTFYVNSGVFQDRSSQAERTEFMRTIKQPEDKNTLTVEQLREIVARGHTIGCHTHRHPHLASLPQEYWDREISHSREVLERLIDKKVTDFSFPFGMRRDFSKELQAYCVSLGFKTIATGISGQLYTKWHNPFELHRTGWKFDLSLQENLKNLTVDGRLYGLIFGRSVIG